MRRLLALRRFIKPPDALTMLLKLGYVLQFIGRIVLFPLWLLSGLLPRRNDLWVFGSWGGHRYADNAASFFEYCQRTAAGRVRLVWIAHDRAVVRQVRRLGYEAYLCWSPRGALACLRAGLHLFDCFAKDTNFWLGRGAIKVNLWSGVPLKVFERDIDTPGTRYYRLFHGSLPERWLLALMMPWHVERPDLIIATSEETARITSRAFDVPAGDVVITGFPRDDQLLEEASRPQAQDLPASFSAAVAAGEILFIYLPTFRDSGKPYYRAIDWRELDALMARCGARLFCKFHPVAETALDSGLQRIEVLPQDIDVYPLLRHTRALISDYSSIIFDYMLLDRPIVYFTPDLEEFVSGSRRLNFQPGDVAVGPLCSTSVELLEVLEHIAQGNRPPGPQSREQVMRRLFDHADANASRRVMAELDRRFLSGTLAHGDDAARSAASLQ